MTLPADVQQFLAEHIGSVAELEALLLMRREPAIRWTDDRLAARLHIDRPSAAAVLDALLGQGLVRASDLGFEYAPRDETSRAQVDSLAELHSRLLIPITHVIHAKPSAAVRRFSDAFRLREKK